VARTEIREGQFKIKTRGKLRGQLTESVVPKSITAAAASVVAAASVGALELDLGAPVHPAVGSKPGGDLLVVANVVAVLRWMGVAVPLLVVANVVAVLLWMGAAVPSVAWLVTIELVLLPRWCPAVEWPGKVLLVAATLRVALRGECGQKSSTNAVF
jgi:hypothetical protein